MLIAVQHTVRSRCAEDCIGYRSLEDSEYAICRAACSTSTAVWQGHVQLYAPS